MKVAVTGVGGGVGQSILKALKNTEYETVGIDTLPDAMGLHYADKGYLGKEALRGGYIERLIDICRKENCQFLFPGLDVELKPLAENRNWIEGYGVTVIVSRMPVIELSNDKYKLSRFLESKGFPFIKSATNLEEMSAKKIPFPVIVKPQVGGWGSKGVKICQTIGELTQYWAKAYPGQMIQEYIEGDEYTCGSVTCGIKVMGAILMRRELRSGDTHKAFVVKDTKLEAFLYDFLAEILPLGPCNIQLRVKDGVPYIFEINARCSGTTGARAIAGFNEPKMICDFLSGKEVSYSIKEIAILRYWQEYPVAYSQIERMKNA